jgi:hypothetical protein
MRSAVAFLAVVALLSCCRIAAAKSQSLLKGTQGVQMDGVTVAWTLNDAENSVTFTAEGMPVSCVHTQRAAHGRVVRPLRPVQVAPLHTDRLFTDRAPCCAAAAPTGAP